MIEIFLRKYAVVIHWIKLTKTYQFPCSYTQLLVCEVSGNLWLLLVCGGFQIILPALNHFQFGEWIGFAKIYLFPCSLAQLSMFPSKLRSFFFIHIFIRLWAGGIWESDYIPDHRLGHRFGMKCLIGELWRWLWILTRAKFYPLVIAHESIFFILFLSSPRIKRTPIWTLSETAELTTSDGQIPKTLSFRCNHHHFFDILTQPGT